MSFEIPNYTLLRKLGEGAMAEVWLGEHKRNGRKAAIKILKPSATADSDFEKLFLREGQVLDGVAGLWCVNAGHARPRIVQAIQQQAAVLDYAPPFQMSHPKAFELARRVARFPP